MDYVFLSKEQLAKAQDLVDDCAYYAPVELSKIGGLVLGCLSGEKLVSTVWLSLTGHRAYLDYLVAHKDHKGAGVRILLVAQAFLKGAGIKEVHFEVHWRNHEAAKLAGLFGADLDGPYKLGYAHIGE